MSSETKLSAPRNGSRDTAPASYRGPQRQVLRQQRELTVRGVRCSTTAIHAARRTGRAWRAGAESGARRGARSAETEKSITLDMMAPTKPKQRLFEPPLMRTAVRVADLNCIPCSPHEKFRLPVVGALGILTVHLVQTVLPLVWRWRWYLFLPVCSGLVGRSRVAPLGPPCEGDRLARLHPRAADPRSDRTTHHGPCNAVWDRPSRNVGRPCCRKQTRRLLLDDHQTGKA